MNDRNLLMSRQPSWISRCIRSQRSHVISRPSRLWSYVFWMLPKASCPAAWSSCFQMWWSPNTSEPARGPNLYQMAVVYGGPPPPSPPWSPPCGSSRQIMHETYMWSVPQDRLTSRALHYGPPVIGRHRCCLQGIYGIISSLIWNTCLVKLVPQGALMGCKTLPKQTNLPSDTIFPHFLMCSVLGVLWRSSFQCKEHKLIFITNVFSTSCFVRIWDV